MPYVIASIILQLLTHGLSKPSTSCSKEGEQGRRKINQYTRYGTIVVASFQAFGSSPRASRPDNDTGGAGDVVAHPGWASAS